MSCFLIRHSDRLAEVGNRLLEGGAAERLIARLAPPFDREVVEPGLCEVMRDHLRLRRRGVAQDLRCAAMQRPATAPKEAIVSCVLDQCMLETVVGLRRDAVDKQDVRLREPLERRLQSRLVQVRNRLQQRVREATSKH